jgi:hypothetical protein
MEFFAQLPCAPSRMSASGSDPSAVRHDRPAGADEERVARGGQTTTPTSMPAAYCPKCGRMVATLDGRRITHQIRFNEGWCKGEDFAETGHR